MIEIFKTNPLVLLFVVAALGYLIGSIKIKGSGLGVAAVLFVGLGCGALDPDLRISELVIFLGLSVFIYMIALQSGATFFSTFQKNNGVRDIFFVFMMLLFSAAITVGLHFAFHFEAATTAGLFSGVSTNTASLAGLLDLISKKTPMAVEDSIAQLAVVGYSLSYPMGVIGVMIAIKVVHSILKVDYEEEARQLSKDYPYQQKLESSTVRITNEGVIGKSIRELLKTYDWKVVFGRMQSHGELRLPNWDTILQKNDEITVVGNEEELRQVAMILGMLSKEHLSNDRTEYDVRELFVSNPQVAGQSLASLNLSAQFSTIITRIQRGDIDLLATGSTVLELGDRVRLVAHRKDMEALRQVFGDSYERLSHIDLLSFGSGMALGLLLGMINFQFSEDVNFQLGFAGGPLIVGLILGALRRTGPIVWTLPYSANLTIRQFSLILLLAGIGINSGHTFLTTLQGGSGGIIFLSGTIISIISAITTLLVGYKLLKIPFTVLLGMVSHQPAILDFATEQSKNKLPMIGFTLMLPISLITKILFVQLLYILLNA